MLTSLRRNSTLIVFLFGATLTTTGVAVLLAAAAHRWIGPVAAWGLFAATVGAGIAVGAHQVPRMTIEEHA